MRPVVTPTEMAAIDAAAPEPMEELIERAGWATARAAKRLLGPSMYGKRIAVLAGKGNNGADGHSAARYLERTGARCSVFEVSRASKPAGGRPGRSPSFDLVIDACYGTGLRGDFDQGSLSITVGDTPVLAVDIPSGVDGSTGALQGHPLCATATITFAALKSGLLLDPGLRYCGSIEVADIGLDCSRATIWQLESADIAAHWPARTPTDHKWHRAVYVVGGSPGLTGAPGLTATAALRAGAGYVALTIPGQVESAAGTAGPIASAAGTAGPIEAVTYPASTAWAEPVLERIGRFGCAVIGPGLVTSDPTELGRYIETTTTPTVFDAGAFDGLAQIVERNPGALRAAGAGQRGSEPLHVLTPHDGEYRRLLGQDPGQDRIAAARFAAQKLGAVVLLKGPTTVVAHPDQRVLVSNSADQRLATAGSGDVLAGVIGAGIAGGLDSFHAAAVAAELHGQAGFRGYRVGLTAGDLPSLIAGTLSDSC